MRSILMLLVLYLLAPHGFSYASNDYSENLHKERMSLCKIDHIEIAHFYMNIKRKSFEEYEKYCRGVTLESDNGEYVKCLGKEPSYSEEKKKYLSEIIKNLYASRIAEVIEVSTADNPPSNSFLGRLQIKVEYHNGTGSDGSRYVVTHSAELQEQALSRSGREGFMFLDMWHDIGIAEGITNADMAALKLVANVASKIGKTFQEAREYCTKYNLIQQ